VKDQGLLNLQWALALFEGLVEAGVEQVVISPGSRSTPLVLAATLLPRLKWQTVLDERSAAFRALGMAKASERPVALVATSGSAPGNWLPAVMEASESSQPLILLSANRPWELQQCGANQTTDQSRLFGSHVRAFHQISEPVEGGGRSRLRALGRQLVLESCWPDPGPVHLDFPFREPLVPRQLPEQADEVVAARPAQLPLLQPPVVLVKQLLHHFPAGPGILIGGAGLKDPLPVMALAERLGAPLLADPLSGLRFSGRASANLITGYSRFLHEEKMQ
jgi:2-succinyl-5-enolpyruvyl-6-hydroxy-3-cyclohexene-1-carboxylate synthase